MNVLVTGFDPFGGEAINPASEVIALLPEEINGHKIISLQIPTVFHESLNCIEQAIKQYNPDVILSIGQAGGRSDITIERVAINCDDARIADNNGNSPVDEKIFKEGPDAYLLTLPIKAMAKAINDKGIPASISNTAGTFVCNHVAYGAAHIAKKYNSNTKTGFIHIPFLPSQTVGKRDMPSMSLDNLVLGITASIEAIIDNPVDILQNAGAEH